MLNPSSPLTRLLDGNKGRGTLRGGAHLSNVRQHLALAALCALLGGCIVVPPGHPPIPPIPPEQVTAPPPSHTALIWQPGHYEWNGATYVWIQGAWIERAGHGTLWQDGYWQPTGAGSVWVPGHWM